MHHFPTREALLIEAVTASRAAARRSRRVRARPVALRDPKHREAVLDAAWAQFTSPEALAAAQLWIAAWSEPELARALRDLERRIEGILEATSAMILGDQAKAERYPVILDAAISLIRGLILAIPIAGREEVDRRWQAMKPILLQAADDLFAEDG